jgi:hypothetical protein
MEIKRTLALLRFLRRRPSTYCEQLLSNKIRMTVPRADTAREPRHPRRLEKKANILYSSLA